MKPHSLSRAALLAVAAALPWSPAAAARDPLTIATTSGKLHGVDLGNKRQWRGIPYAAPPVGNLRWKAPVSPAPWSGTREATEFGSACSQPSWDEQGNLFTYGNEDCLFLNVSVPPGATSGSELAVLVDLHGGSNIYGQAIEDTSSFIRHGIIVVTLNYRLGIFGMLAHPALSAEDGGSSSNYGIHDQMAALKWVKTNISAFGGNPQKVSISGFSAGAGDVITLTASPLATGLFQGAIGSSFDHVNVLGESNNSLAQREQEGIAFASQVGCGNATDVAACLRSRATDALVLASPYFDNMGAAVGGKVLPKPAIDLIKENSTVPLFIGDGREEAGWAAFDPVTPDPMPRDRYALLMQDLFGSQALAAGIALYSTDSNSNWLNYIRAQTDYNTVCPTRRVALATGAPTYRYLWTHVLQDPDFPSQVLSAHGTDMVLLWHQSWYPFTDVEELLSYQMSRYYSNFVKTGNPNDDTLPATWPLFDKSSESYLELGDTFIAHPTGYHIPHCELIDDVQDTGTRCGTLCKWFTARNMPAVLQRILQIGRFTE